MNKLLLLTLLTSYPLITHNFAAKQAPSTPTTNTDDDENFDLASNLDWLFNPNLPIPGMSNMPPAYVAPAPLSTPADILAAIKKLSTPEQAQITQALVTPADLGQLIGTLNQNGINQLLATSPFGNKPTMPTSNNTSAQEYLTKLNNALSTLQTIMNDTINSSTLASLPMANYLRDQMLYFAATLAQPTTTA